MEFRLKIGEMAQKHRGWNMKTLAERLGVEHQTVLYWNQGRSCPRLRMMLRICRLLGCKLHDLVD